MLSFRKKILLSDIALFLLFFLVIYFCKGSHIGILGLGTVILLVYTLLTVILVLRFSWPIQIILDAITPYQEEKVEYLPRIVIPRGHSEEFNKLATTLNSLTEKIRKQIETLKSQRKEIRGILESLAEGVIAVDTSATIIFANRVACQMLSLPHEVGIKCHFSDRPLHKKCQELVLEALQTSESIKQGWVEPLPQGNVYYDLFSAPLSEQSGAILVLFDKTSDHKLMEMGKHFIANASHELRTPITILRGFAEMLQDSRKLSPTVLNDIGLKMVKTCTRLEKLVKSLLMLADIENLHEEQFYPCDLISIAENCQHLLLTAHPGVHISFYKEIKSAPILADGDLLDMAIMNILENAVRYSPSPAHIEMTASQNAEGQYQLAIIDLGIGIPEVDLPHIFNRFYTVDKARSRKFGGSGLGLSIVRTIVEKHKGKITVASELKKGSRFTLTFSGLEGAEK